MPPSSSSQPVHIRAIPSSHPPNLPLPSHFPSPTAHGTVTWATLLSAPSTPPDTFTAGLASCAPHGGTLAMNTHAQAEIYYALGGEAEVVVGEERFVVRAGDMLYIPGGVRHRVVNRGREEFRWVYLFAVGGLGEVEYVFEREVEAKL